MSKPRLLPLVAAAAVLGLSSSAATPATNALSGVDFADPFVLRDGATYYAFATGANGRHIQLASSTDLATWTVRDDALPVLPTWAAPRTDFTWAPSALRRDDGYVLYYTTRDRTSDFQCMSRAVAPRPEGPYIDDSTRPFVCQTRLCGSIDPSPFVDEDGSAYLLWKSDENDPRCGGASRIWSQRLTDDGLAVTGSAVALMGLDQAWEHPLVEGPSMVARDGVHHLFYSANWYESSSYAIGHATCTTPSGPCTKSPGPLFSSTGLELGPGGQEPFEDGKGATLLAYHAWTAPNATYGSGGARSLRFARLAFREGKPVVSPHPVAASPPLLHESR